MPYLLLAPRVWEFIHKHPWRSTAHGIGIHSVAKFTSSREWTRANQWNHIAGFWNTAFDVCSSALLYFQPFRYCHVLERILIGPIIYLKPRGLLRMLMWHGFLVMVILYALRIFSIGDLCIPATKHFSEVLYLMMVNILIRTLGLSCMQPNGKVNYPFLNIYTD